MHKSLKITVYGILIWLVPFVVSFFFVDKDGNYLIRETFFKSIMVITGALTGVFLAVVYFRQIKTGYMNEGTRVGILWFAINLALDLIMVYVGFFGMTYTQYFQDIGLRYLSIPIYTIGLGCALECKRDI